MKTRIMENTPTRVLLVRDWTIFLETVCIAEGKSCRHKFDIKYSEKMKEKNHTRLNVQFLCLQKLHYLNARVYGTDEEDVCEDDEDTDVDSQHNWCTAGRNTRRQV